MGDTFSDSLSGRGDTTSAGDNCSEEQLKEKRKREIEGVERGARQSSRIQSGPAFPLRLIALPKWITNDSKLRRVNKICLSVRIVF